MLGVRCKLDSLGRLGSRLGKVGEVPDPVPRANFLTNAAYKRKRCTTLAAHGAQALWLCQPTHIQILI